MLYLENVKKNGQVHFDRQAGHCMDLQLPIIVILDRTLH